jgi:hypothetical protein
LVFLKKFIFIFFSFISGYVVAQIPAITQAGMNPKVQNFTTFSPVQNPVITSELLALTNPSAQTHPEFGKNPYNTQCLDCIELLDKRTEKSRYYVKNGSSGRSFSVQHGYESLHYVDQNNKLISIDARLRPHPSQANTYYAPDQQQPTLIDANTGSTSIQLNGFDLEFNLNPQVLQLAQNTEAIVFGAISMSNTSVGEDGALTTNAWPGINRTVTFDRGAIKTNFVIGAAPSLPLTGGWLAFEEKINIPAGFKLKKDSVAGDFSTMEGYWHGDLKLIRESDNAEFARWSTISILDGAGMPVSANFSAYQIKLVNSDVYLRTLVNVSWLGDPNTIYPITVDPLVSGTNTWTAGLIGFTPYAPGNGFCGSSSAYCQAGPLTVIFPGQATITNVLWSSQYIATAPTAMQDGGFRMVGPCGENPILTNNWWSCASILSGTCSGVNNVVPNLATCLAPSCFTSAIDFYIRNIHCNNNVPGACNTNRLKTVNNSWIVTVQGETVQQPPVPATSNGTLMCSGMCTTLTATGQYGVPPYTYSWNPGGITGNPISVCPPPNTTTTYTCVITDVCGLTATNSIAITTQSATLPTPIVNVQMNPPSGSPCPVTVTACSDVGNNYGGGSETYTWNFPGGTQISGGSLSGSASGPAYGGAGSHTFCAGGTFYQLTYNSAGTYALGIGLTKAGNCAYGDASVTVVCAVLPLEVIDYYLKYNGSVCELNWVTATERNTDYFLVEKSSDGINYSYVDKIIAAGNSNSQKKYMTRDLNPDKFNNTYYRLRVAEPGKGFGDLNLVRVLHPAEQRSSALKIQPNPVNSKLEIYLPQDFVDQPVNLQVFDNSGKKVYSTTLNSNSSLTPYSLSVEDLQNGMYSILLFDEHGNSLKTTFVKN